MENKNTSAFPIQPTFNTEGQICNERFAFEGLTKREYFMAFAPNEIPGWFKVESKIKRPNAPKSWTEFPIDDPHREELKNWQHDPIYDLPEELQWYQKLWEQYHNLLRDYDRMIEAERYFAWRTYYADELLNQI